MSSPSPTVSVCCITYNHEAYLAQAIESVLVQQTDFAVEMVIGEDCSTDSTRRIAQEYEHKYPERIRVLTPAHNLGIMPSLMATMASRTGAPYPISESASRQALCLPFYQELESEQVRRIARLLRQALAA
ncbi:glycosyltransferase [Hymenobacter artigasi]|uniref:GT2 family glycosyltransferase n=1 Tax=Hymenobacter artigasi TaxID=2719616 RepID=A0ABX1HMK6_9BACT|nr:glycosyltransferase [Hymenobacter artigasi]NKI91486.1 GT2 family glycosyltransferase [Hymenobacter artigasi]